MILVKMASYKIIYFTCIQNNDLDYFYAGYN